MRWLTLAVVLALTGCRMGHPPRIGERPARLPDAAKERAYAEVLARYSDQAELYDQFDTRLFAGATFEAWPFREARANRLADFHALPEALRAERLAAERERFSAAHELMFGVHVTDHRHDDFDRRNSIWRVALVTSAGEFAPAKIERIGRADLAMRALYPYLDDFWTAYRITFPRLTPEGGAVIPPGPDRITLRVASSLGRIELAFPGE